jgi:hypothetical protein
LDKRRKDAIDLASQYSNLISGYKILIHAGHHVKLPIFIKRGDTMEHTHDFTRYICCPHCGKREGDITEQPEKKESYILDYIFSPIIVLIAGAAIVGVPAILYLIFTFLSTVHWGE